MSKRAAPRKSVPSPSKSAAETRRILKQLGTQHPNADTELHFTNAYELLVATILSAQCTDERVNQVTPALFARYPDARALAAGDDRRARAADSIDGIFPRQVALAPGHGDRSRRDASGARCRARWTRSSSCRASAERPPTSSSVMRSACRACPSTATSCAWPTGSASPGPTTPKSWKQQLCARHAAARRGRGRPTRSSCTAAASASRARSAIGASSAPTAISMRT